MCRCRGVLHVQYLVDDLPITAKDIATRTGKVPILSKVYEFTLSDWANVCEDALVPYFMVKAKLSLEDGCIL